jgi:cell division protease FtsH
MDARIGQRTYAPRPQMFLPNPQDLVVSAADLTGREIDLAVRDLIETADQTALKVLQERRADLEAGVKLLLEKETISADDFEPLRSKGGRAAQVPARQAS